VRSLAVRLPVEALPDRIEPADKVATVTSPVDDKPELPRTTP